MSNVEICRVLRNVAAALSIKNEKKFRFQIIAYQKAADEIENSNVEVGDLLREKKLEKLPGVGASIRSHLEEMVNTGHVKHFDSILEDVPSAVFPLLDVTGFGPKKAFRLVNEFKLNNPETVFSDIQKLGKEGRIATLEGFGEKSQSDILRAIEEYGLGKTKGNRMVLPYAGQLADKLVDYLNKSKNVIRVSVLGSLRRRRSTVGDIDIAVASNEPGKVFDHFTTYPGIERIIERGDKSCSILATSGRQVDLMVAPPEGFGALLQHFTGSKAHNIHLREHALSKGLSLSEYGIRKVGTKKDESQIMKFKTEEEFYEALDMDWIPPELREDNGEIEAAIKHDLPNLVRLEDIKGDFHIHSSYPIEPSHDMGQNSMEEMIEQALKLKYKYLGFSEHSPSISKHSNRKIYEILTLRSKYIERLRLKYKNIIRIYSLLEIDILPDGSLAIEDEAMDLLDGGIVSIHSNFDMDKDKMTERVLKGLSHPKAKILAHPTGRLLNQRSGYELDWDLIFNFCKENKKAIEINAWPLRLDLPDTLVKRAVDKGVILVIDTDSHDLKQMEMMKYGISVARRGWATCNDILNTKSYNEIDEWIEI